MLLFRYLQKSPVPLFSVIFHLFLICYPKFYYYKLSPVWKCWYVCSTFFFCIMQSHKHTQNRDNGVMSPITKFQSKSTFCHNFPIDHFCWFYGYYYFSWSILKQIPGPISFHLSILQCIVSGCFTLIHAEIHQWVWVVILWFFCCNASHQRCI